jgi:hypothetical protein
MQCPNRPEFFKSSTVCDRLWLLRWQIATPQFFEIRRKDAESASDINHQWEKMHPVVMIIWTNSDDGRTFHTSAMTLERRPREGIEANSQRTRVTPVCAVAAVENWRGAMSRPVKAFRALRDLVAQCSQ